MFKKATAFIILVGLALVTGIAVADDTTLRPRPGTRGTVSAFEADGVTVIDVKWCARDRYGAHDYTVCGNLLRDEVKTRMCARGPGVHAWVYQISDNRPMPTSVYCR